MEYHREDKTKEKTKKRRKKKKSNKNELPNKTFSINIVSEIDNQDHRKDDDLEQGEDIYLQLSMQENDEDDSEKRCCKSCLIPELKTVGKCHSVWSGVDYWILLTIILSEKKVLPSLVLASYIVYFAVACDFYFK